MYLLVLTVILSALDSSYCYVRFPRNERSVENKYDYLVFSQSWPQTQCWGINKLWKNENKGCSACPASQTETGWTIHGLWPTNRDGSHVGFCSKTKYSSNLLTNSLRNEMEIKWPTYKMTSSQDGFWKHEYEKHGTCATDIESADTLPEFFSKTLELFDLYDIGRALQASQIVPGNEYTTSEIRSAIKQSLGVNSTPVCLFHPKSKAQYLSEIYICFDRFFNLVDCSTTTGSNAECKPDQEIIYPENMESCQ